MLRHSGAAAEAAAGRTSAEGKLGILRHSVALVEDDQLEARAATRGGQGRAVSDACAGVKAALRSGLRSCKRHT